jgi:hypothetical protein
LFLFVSFGKWDFMHVFHDLLFFVVIQMQMNMKMWLGHDQMNMQMTWYAFLGLAVG